VGRLGCVDPLERCAPAMPSPLRQTSTPPPSARTTSLPSPPDSSEKTTKAPTRLSSPVIQALEIIRAYHQGYPPDSQWIKIHLQCGDYETLQQQFREESLWGYVEDKIRCLYSLETNSCRTLVRRIVIGMVLTITLSQQIRLESPHS
jgi:hypothetical protein